MIVFSIAVVSDSSAHLVASMMSGLFAVVVVGCAVWMPWSPRWHVGFLVLSAFALVLGLALSPISSVELTVGLLVGIAAILTSGVGAWLVRRRHLRMWGQALLLRRQQAVLLQTIATLEAVAQHSGARFSHGICPECARRLYPEELAAEGGPPTPSSVPS